jgi:hypothetical protein
MCCSVLAGRGGDGRFDGGTEAGIGTKVVNVGSSGAAFGCHDHLTAL